jgi:hypothetical protein
MKTIFNVSYRCLLCKLKLTGWKKTPYQGTEILNLINKPIYKKSDVICSDCKEKNDLKNSNSKEIANQTIKTYSINYKGKKPRNDTLIKSNYFKDKNDAVLELKSICFFYKKDSITELKFEYITKEETSDNGKGTYKYKVWMASGYM